MKAQAWTDVPEELLRQGIRRRIVTGDKLMLGRLYFPKGSTVPAHQHESEQITHVLNGAPFFIVNGSKVRVRAGETLVILPNVKHSAQALEDTDEIDACSPPRHDWLDGSDADLRDSMHSPDNG